MIGRLILDLQTDPAGVPHASSEAKVCAPATHEFAKLPEHGTSEGSVEQLAAVFHAHRPCGTKGAGRQGCHEQCCVNLNHSLICLIILQYSKAQVNSRNEEKPDPYGRALESGLNGGRG